MTLPSRHVGGGSGAADPAGTAPPSDPAGTAPPSGTARAAPSERRTPPARPRVVLVAAIARDGTIGKDGSIPWHFPDDLRFFKRATTGTALVMGRKTHASIGRPLPGRDNIVVTRDPARLAAESPGVLPAASLAEALSLAARRGAATVSVAGGAELYALALPLADELLLTYVPHAGGGDTFFPPWDRTEWEETSREDVGPSVAVRYRRRSSDA